MFSVLKNEISYVKKNMLVGAETWAEKLHPWACLLTQ